MIFAGADGYMAILDNLVQYDKYTGEIIFTKDRVLLLKPYSPPYGPNPKVTNDTLLLKQGYKLYLADVDIINRVAVVQLTSANGDVVYEQVIVDDPGVVENVKLYDNEILIVNADFRGVMAGNTFDGIILKNITQYNKNTVEIILSIDTLSLIKPY